MRRRFWPAEVLQSSALDCGPAALQSVLVGHGLRVSYEHLRRACQTSVDGTSIDVLQAVAGQLGLQAQQRVLPADVLLAREAETLPAIAVTQLPDRRLHFVVIWRRLGPWVSIMDPAVGRRLVRVRDLERDLYVHTLCVPERAYGLLGRRPQLTRALAAKLRRCGVSDAPERVQAVADSGDARGLAGLDAATRFMSMLHSARALGPHAERVLDQLAAGEAPYAAVPEPFWRARPAAAVSGMRVQGAVILSLSKRPAAQRELPEASPALTARQLEALHKTAPTPLWSVLSFLRADGLLRPFILAGCVLLAACGALVEALLLRAALELSQQFGVLQQRATALGALCVFLGALLALEYPIARMTATLGQRLDARVRIALLRSLGQLDASYFASRAGSDVAARAHGVQRLRGLPGLATRFLRTAFELIVTCAGLIWLAPFDTPLIVGGAAAALAIPLLCQVPLRERDARVREHEAARSRLYLDVLLGLGAIRAHAGERAVQGEHNALTAAWAQATRAFTRVGLIADGAQSVVGLAFSVLLLYGAFSRGQGLGSLLLLLYWGLSVPALAQELVILARQYPGMRNIALRVLEPIHAAEDAIAAPASAPESSPPSAAAVALRFSRASVVHAGQAVLSDVDLDVAPGEHIAIVGASGAGKSSLLSLLLGLSECASGSVLVDGQPIAQAIAGGLRDAIAWVDPATHLWNRPLIENLAYGAPRDPEPLSQLLEAAELITLLDSLPDGLQERLGEGGTLLSGGEGQRVRLGRALARRRARLVLLDEPFRGLDRPRRQRLLTRARAHWASATLLCVTHDLAHSAEFGRVWVVAHGRVVEDGAPEVLARAGGSYAALLAAHGTQEERVWNAPHWRHHNLENGGLNATKPRARAASSGSDLRAVVQQARSES